MTARANIFLFLFSSCILFSQEFHLTGKIVDGKGVPVEFGEVLLLQKDSLPVKEEHINNLGEFSFQIDSGDYILKIQQFKRVIYSAAISMNGNHDLGIIKINSIKNINEVILDGKKKLIERKVDRLVFNVENSISATGGDALDAMKVTPGLKVQNDKIYIVGKSGMSVMIDDRLIQLSGNDLINFLRTIRSDEIKSIEVITNPPAKYDAEGNSGIINIKRKKVTPNSWKSLISSRYIQGNYASGGMGANFDYQKNKIYLNLSINYDRTKRKIDENITNLYPSKLWSETRTKKNLFFPFTTRLGFDYKLSPKVITGISFYNSFSEANPTEKGRVVIDRKSVV